MINLARARTDAPMTADLASLASAPGSKRLPSASVTTQLLVLCARAVTMFLHRGHRGHVCIIWICSCTLNPATEALSGGCDSYRLSRCLCTADRITTSVSLLRVLRPMPHARIIRYHHEVESEMRHALKVSTIHLASGYEGQMDATTRRTLQWC